MKINKDRLIFFLKDNKWIIIASILFLAWKFFLVGVLWHDRFSPPEPDDSYVYITHIESVRQCPILFCKDSIYPMNKFGAYSHLIYRVVFGYLAILLNISSESAYYLSFYIGILLSIPVLILFLKNIGLNKNLIAFSIFFLILPSSLNNTNIFTWIIPAFFAFLLFLLILSIILGNYTKWKYYIIIAVPVALYTHTITLYMIPILILYFLFICLFEKKIDRLLLKKILFTLFITIIFYAPLSFYLIKIEDKAIGNPYGIETFLYNSIKESSEFITKKEKDTKIKKGNSIETRKEGPAPSKNILSKYNFKKILPGYEMIRGRYFDLVILNYFSFLIFILSFLINIFYKNYRIISLFLSTLIFIILASINEFAYRLLIFLWFITFVFYACSFWYALCFLKLFSLKKISVILKLSIILTLIIFAIINILLSYFYHSYRNERENYLLNPNYVSYIKNNISSKEYIKYEDYANKTLKYFNLSKDLSWNSIGSFKKDKHLKYYIMIEEKIDQDTIYELSDLNNFINFICHHLKIQRKTRNKTPLVSTDAYIKDNFTLDKEFGNIKIYKNNK